MDKWLCLYICDYSSFGAVSSLVQLQRRNGPYIVALCKVQVIFITIHLYCMFDTTANSKQGADTIFKVLSNTPDITNWNQHKAVDMHAIRTSQFVSVLCVHKVVLDTANFSGKCTHNVLEWEITRHKINYQSIKHSKHIYYNCQYAIYIYIYSAYVLTVNVCIRVWNILSTFTITVSMLYIYIVLMCFLWTSVSNMKHSKHIYYNLNQQMRTNIWFIW